MQVILSASRALATKIKRDLGHELPRITSLDGKNIGTQSLHSDPQQVAWQCQYVPAFYRARHGTVIAIEAFSRYTLLIPAHEQIDTAQMEKSFLKRWVKDLNYWHAVTGSQRKPANEDTQRIIKIEAVHWRTNTDLSINGHIADAEQWLRQYLEDHGRDYLSEQHAQDLGWHLNQQHRRAPKGQDASGSFIPYQRLLTLHDRILTANLSTTARQIDATASNVVDLAKYRKTTEVLKQD